MSRGEFGEVNLDPTVGAEIRKVRPCVIVNRDALARLPLRIIVPLTEWDPRFESAPWHIQIDPTEANGLSKKSSADTFQVSSISQQRLVRQLGVISASDMSKINKGLVLSLALDK